MPHIILPPAFTLAALTAKAEAHAQPMLHAARAFAALHGIAL